MILLPVSVAAALAAVPGKITQQLPQKVKDFLGARTIQSELQELRTIRVRLRESAPSITVRGFDLTWSIADGTAGGNPTPPLRINQQTEWKITCPTSRSVRAVANQRASSIKPVTSQSGGVSVESPGGFLNVDGQPFRQRLSIYATNQGCEVVNVVDLEDYLDGLVNSEISAKWNEATIGAQVVAARTYAIRRMWEARKKSGRHADKNYDVEATVKDQVYHGFAKEDYRSSRVIDETRGEILLAASGEPLSAFYHSTCGGLTELPEAVWGARAAGFRSRVACPFCKSSPVFRWKLELTEQALRETVLKEMRPSGRSGSSRGSGGREKERYSKAQLEAVEVGAKVAGRVQQVRLRWRTLGKAPETKETWETSVSGATLRNWLGPARFRSTAFDVSRLPEGKGWLFTGQGNGHGVGLCQWGAKVMGDSGRTTAEILEHYYPDAHRTKLW